MYRYTSPYTQEYLLLKNRMLIDRDSNFLRQKVTDGQLDIKDVVVIKV